MRMVLNNKASLLAKSLRIRTVGVDKSKFNTGKDP